MTQTEKMNLNTDLIKAKINELPEINYDTVSDYIPQLLAEGKLTLDTTAYTAEDASVGRYLVYNHSEPQNAFSIWVFAIGPQGKTSIHDHKYKGTVTVLEGPVSEKYYQPTEGDLVKRVGRADRYKLHTNRDDLNDGFVHQLKRRKYLGAGVSVTLHIYKMEAHLINEEGKTIDNRNLSTVFFKDRRKESLHSKEKYQQLYKSPSL